MADGKIGNPPRTPTAADLEIMDQHPDWVIDAEMAADWVIDADMAASSRPRDGRLAEFLAQHDPETLQRAPAFTTVSIDEYLQLKPRRWWHVTGVLQVLTLLFGLSTIVLAVLLYLKG